MNIRKTLLIGEFMKYGNVETFTEMILKRKEYSN